MLILVISLSFTGESFARELPYIYKGVRPMGMGGTFIAISDNADALFYNPAGLADIKTNKLSILSLELESSTEAYNMLSDALDVDFDNDQETASFLRKYIGEYGHSSVTAFSSYIRPNFAFGVIGTVKANLQPRNFQYPDLNINIIEDAGVCTGYAYPFFDGNLLIGAGVKYLFRRSLDEEYTVAEITTDGFKDRMEDDFQDGNGTLIDLGIIYKIGSYKIAQQQATIQAGLSVSNLVGGKLGEAEDLDPHVDLGVATHIGENLILAFDYVDILYQLGDDNNFGKRFHFGLEYYLTEIIIARVGLNQGYPTFGLGIETKNIQLDLITYAEEVGTYSGQYDDRRYLLRMGFGF